MGSAADWLKEERRKTLGDWVAICAECGHGQRYFSETEAEVSNNCPTCGEIMLLRCPDCDWRFSSMFVVTCEKCDFKVRVEKQFGTAIRRKKPGFKTN